MSIATGWTLMVDKIVFGIAIALRQINGHRCLSVAGTERFPAPAPRCSKEFRFHRQLLAAESIEQGQPDRASFAREAMSVRASLGTCLIAAALLSGAGSANGQDPSIARATAASAGLDGCVRYVARQAMVVRCALAEPQILSDHGMTAGEPYNVQGTPIDRHGNVVAVPEDGRAPLAREVFASERRTLP